MPENESKTRARRTPEERVAAVDEKIRQLKDSLSENEAKKDKAIAGYDKKSAAIKEQIKAQEAKKAAILAPKPPRKTKAQKIAELVKMAEKSGMKVDEIASRLDLEPPK